MSTDPNPLMSGLDEEKRDAIVKITMKLIEMGYEAKFQLPIIEGPLIYGYRFRPEGKTRVSHLENLAQDMAVTLGVEDVLVKRMPGETSVGFYIPRRERTPITFLGTVNNVAKFLLEHPDSVPLNLGVDYLGKPAVEDLTELPHLLIAGTTGGGKSTLLHSLIASIVYTLNNSDVQLVMSDTKGVEFGHFIGSPHLLFPPATTVYQTLEQMDWLLEEMQSRLDRIGSARLRNIKEFNQANPKNKLPYIVLLIDELADLMLGKKEESSLAEKKLMLLVQKSRAAGIHVIAATQRPSVKVVAGTIKANFPARLSFKLPSQVDSRTVLDTDGAEHLLGKGDCLFISGTRPGLHRIHAPYTSIKDVQNAVEFSLYKETVKQLEQ